MGIRGTLIGWVDGEYGKGVWKSYNTALFYAGTFKNTKADGHGIFHAPNKWHVEGGWVNGFQRGHGTAFIKGDRAENINGYGKGQFDIVKGDSYSWFGYGWFWPADIVN